VERCLRIGLRVSGRRRRKERGAEEERWNLEDSRSSNGASRGRE
jgi:hypothetical protein